VLEKITVTRETNLRSKG